MTAPLVIGIAGGSGSGKSTLANALAEALPRPTSILRHDSYYHDMSKLPASDSATVNFDSREAIETPLFVKHLDQLSPARRSSPQSMTLRRTHVLQPATRFLQRTSSSRKVSWFSSNQRSANVWA